MTLINSHPAGRGRPAPALTGSAATHVVRKVWAVVWLVAVPLLLATWVDMQLGNAWGTIPAVWLDGSPPAMNTAPALAASVAAGVCAVLHQMGADLLIGVLPVAVALAAHLGFGGSPAGWIGGVVGLAVGALVWRRRQGH